jgi:hypothetical protein
MHLPEDSVDVVGYLSAPTLPALPTAPPPEQPVVVARWVGPRFAALRILFRYRNESEEEVDDDILLYQREPSGDWRELEGSGGSNWAEGPAASLQRQVSNPASVLLGAPQVFEHGGVKVAAADGEAGAAASWIEVQDFDGRTRRRVESPLGLFVVCWNGASCAVLLVLAEDGRELKRRDFGPV